ncbi:Fic family protein [Glutamicibacter sp. NPDC087344]|uniref:Fic family protein n=1 Tax=Glutamicibacter sp. NPDC087344 TaxID=3363994 RepID=UPI0038055CB1
MSGLEREGDKTPGAYRTNDVQIKGSSHRPPSFVSVQADMQELLDFVNQDMDRSFDLLKVAIAHHRFVWIHPFGNGNGRTCRLITYAIMVSQGFTATTGYRAIDPTAVFGADRISYYAHLEAADSLEPADLIQWCTYLLEGMLLDLKKLERLGDHRFVINDLLIPSLKRAHTAGMIGAEVLSVLEVFAHKTVVRASDLAEAFDGTSVARSQLIRRLIDHQLIEPIADGKRSYRLVLSPGPLTTFVLRQLDELGFLPQILRDDL